MFAGSQPNQGNPFPLNSQAASVGGGLFGANKSTQSNPVFGNQQNKPIGGNNGGLFGGNQNSTNGGGLFGNGVPQQQQGGGLFGPQQPNAGGVLFGGAGNTQQGTPFGGQQQMQQQALNPFNAPKPGGLFGGTSQPQQIGGLLGAQQQPAQQSSLFGQQNLPQQQQTGLFGQTQQTGGGLFGGGGVQPQQSGGLFNQGQQNQQQPGGLFGLPQQGQGGGLFGNQNQSNGGGGIFGQQPTQQTGGGLFGQNQATQQQSGGLFGAYQQKSTGLFNGQAQQSASSLFGQQTQPANTFGQSQQQNPLWNNQQSTTPAWGGQSTMFAGNTQPQTNQLGGTSWGVNTASFGQTQSNTTQTPPVTPVKSKNSKVDGKHLVKCIAALDQYTGMSKEEIRCYFLMTGGVPASQNNQTQSPFNQQNNPGLWKKPPTQGNTSFGQISTPTTGSLFGATQGLGTTSSFGQKPTTSMFGTTVPQTQGTSLFGTNNQPIQQQGGSLFGGQATQQQGSIFGSQSPQTTGSLFGQTQQAQGSFGQNQGAGSLFGNQPTATVFGQNPQASGNIFGGQPAQQGGSFLGGLQGLFGNQQNQQQGGSLFGSPQPQSQPIQQGGSLFGVNQQQQGPSFGVSQPVSGPVSRFTNLQAGENFFGNRPQLEYQAGVNQSQPVGSLFGGQQVEQLLAKGLYQNQENLFGGYPVQATAPYANNLNMLTSIPLQKTILPNQSILNPNYNQQKNNILGVVLSALVTSGALSEADADKLLKPTPFDELVKKRQKQLENQVEQYRDVPSVFEDPLNFKKLEIPDDYFERKKQFFYWTKQKEKQANDKLKFHSVNVQKKKKPSPNLNPLRQQPDDISKVLKTHKLATEAELPTNQIYELKPSRLRLTKMTVNDLKQVQNVQIIGSHGKIKFLEPISLLYKDIDSCVSIQQDTIDILESDWQNKKCQLTFLNFGSYDKKSEKDQQKIIEKMEKWIKKNHQQNMELVSFDRNEGTLVVTIH